MLEMYTRDKHIDKSVYIYIFSLGSDFSYLLFKRSSSSKKNLVLIRSFDFVECELGFNFTSSYFCRSRKLII